MRYDIRVDATFGVEPSTPLMVGEWYLRSRSAHRDPQVIEAYRQLQVETDHLFTLLTRDTCDCGVRVEFTHCGQPYESDEELIFAVRTDGTLEITSAATAGERLHPLLDCEFGGAFDRFRAVHDFIGHAWCGYGFDLDDERAAWSAQDRLHSGLARFALATELYGVNAARGIVGEAPDLRALLLAPSTCRHHRRRLKRRGEGNLRDVGVTSSLHPDRASAHLSTHRSVVRIGDGIYGCSAGS